MDFISADIETLGLTTEYDVIELAMIYCKTGVPLEKCSTIRFTFDIPNKPLKANMFCMLMHQELIKEINSAEYNTYVSPRNYGTDHNPFYPRIHPDKIQGLIREWYIYNNIPENNKLLFAGKNFANFDINWFKKHGWDNVTLQGKWPMHHRTLDPAILYVEDDDNTIPNLEECIKRSGQQVFLNAYGKLHNALYDALAVAALIREKLKI